MLDETKMETVLEECFGGDPLRPTFHLYGDASYYDCGSAIITPDDMVSDEQRARASSVRISVANTLDWVKGKR